MITNGKDLTVFMIAVIDYGAGNLKSVHNALAHLGVPARTVTHAAGLMESPAAILPGVGAFGDAMRELDARGFSSAIREFAGSGRPLLGICLGLQLLFERSEESPGAAGLGLLPGVIRRFPEGERKVPQIGWNSLKILRPGRLLRGVPDGSFVYFVHSYYLDAADPDDVSAEAEYGVRFGAAVERGKVCAAQFHPEKSGEAGLLMLRNFADLALEGGNAPC